MYELPTSLRAQLTDALVEELTAQFALSDVDGSGALDESEFLALLQRMGLLSTDSDTVHATALVDTDGDGRVTFTELASAVVQIQRGGARFAALRQLLVTLDTTPVAALEREARAFVSVRVPSKRSPRPSTVSHPCCWHLYVLLHTCCA